METSLSENKKFWDSEASSLLINPRFAIQEKELLARAVEKYDEKGRIWLRSSGTESSGKGIKLVALKKSAILKAAKSVNDFFGLSEKDVWLCGLPIFHIGGLSIYARASLSKCLVVRLKSWNVESFEKLIKNEKVTVCSLVPTQVFDLVNAKIAAPKNMKLVIVGGGALNSDLLEKASELGWPIAVSYGMTETSALMAATNPKNIKTPMATKMELLPHVELHPAAEKWAIESESLFDAYLWVSQEEAKYEPRPEPFVLDDHLQVESREIKVLGRESEIVKILGETVNLNELKEKISPFYKKPFFIQPIGDSRRGFRLEVYVEESLDGRFVDLEVINQRLMPYERVSKLRFVDQFVRTSLGKINKPETIRKIKRLKEDIN